MTSRVHHRLVSLDIFRGVTIGGMIVVNNLQSWSDIPSRFPRLVHAEWNGCTLADLIYPLFIFIVGVTTAYSLDQRIKTGESLSRLYRHILIRTAAIFFPGPGGGQLVHRGLAVPIDLPAHPHSEERLGHISLPAGGHQRLVLFPRQPADYGHPAAHCPRLPGGLPPPAPYPLARAGAGDWRFTAHLLGPDEPPGLRTPTGAGPRHFY